MEFFATSHGKGPVDAISGTVKWLVNNNIIRRVDDAESFFNSLVTCNTKTKSCYISSNNINSIAEKDLQIISSNVSALNGIFTSHQIKTVNGHTEIWPYSQALCDINPLSNIETKNIEKENFVGVSLTKEVTVGSFIVYYYIPYLFSSSSSADTLVSRKFVADVLTNAKENDTEIEYGSAVSKKRIKFIGNDKGSISKYSILAILPQPNYMRGVYEFLDELEIDVFW